MIDAEQIPRQINGESKQLLESYIRKHRKDKQEADTTGHKVSREMCKVMNNLYEDGTQPKELLEIFPINSKSTLYYHLNDECTHSYRTLITYDECGWIRHYAKKGAPTSTLAMLYDTQSNTIAKHAKGECDHDHGCDTVDRDDLLENSGRDVSYTETECVVCGDTFQHKEWRSRNCCSEECSARKAGKASHGLSTD